MFDEVCRICQMAYGRDRCTACGRVYCEDCAGKCIERQCPEPICTDCVVAVPLPDDPTDFEVYCPQHAQMELQRRKVAA